MLSQVQKKKAIDSYSKREATIKQLAQKNKTSYETMRKILVQAGFSNGLKVK